MPGVGRFTVSVSADLLARFDRQVQAQGYPTRSKAVADLIAASLVRREWAEGGEVAGAVVLVYDHHKRELSHTLTCVQHDFHDLIVSTQHIHLDHHNCLEVVVLKGAAGKVQAVVEALQAVKGVKHASLAMASYGQEL
jgi:CopG family nickel-responsive transcriptional regulator